MGFLLLEVYLGFHKPLAVIGVLQAPSKFRCSKNYRKS